jgi:ComF family protein
MRLSRRLLAILLPTSCSYCNSSIDDSPIPFFCSSCWSDFAVLTAPLCPQCGRQFDSPEALLQSPDHRCSECRRHSPRFDQALSVGAFEGPLREAIHQFKYRPCRSLGKPIADWMAAHLLPIRSIDLVIPVPLHRTRLRQRGFNQAVLLAAALAKHFILPLCYDNLIRLRATRPQVELSGNERKKNVSGAFGLVRPEEVAGKSILLIDDVFTTGATMNECAGVLKKAGVSQVHALTAARAME